jgi:hypothetical protein
VVPDVAVVRDAEDVLAVRLVPPFLVNDATDTVGATVTAARAVLEPVLVPAVVPALVLGLEAALAAALFDVSVPLAAVASSEAVAGAALAALSPDPQAARLAVKRVQNRVRLNEVVRSIMRYRLLVWVAVLLAILHLTESVGFWMK